jgi:hypothetical protein
VAYEISWAVQKRVIYLRFSGSVTCTEIEEVSPQFVQYNQQGEQPLHVIVDTLSITSFPHDVRWMIDMLRSGSRPQGWSLFVVTDPSLQFLLTLVLRLTKDPFRIFSCKVAAETFLREQDDTLAQMCIT